MSWFFFKAKVVVRGFGEGLLIKRGSYIFKILLYAFLLTQVGVFNKYNGFVGDFFTDPVVNVTVW